MLKTTILAILFAGSATAEPGAVTYRQYNDAIGHVVERIKTAHAHPLRVCYDNADKERATAILMQARLADGKPLAYEMLRLEKGGYRLATVADPDTWPRKVACQEI